MKNRYFGDIYDYIKYALLRRLMDEDGCSAAVCWMLTEDDGGKDGNRTGYLGEPARWSSFEPTIFEFLRRHVVERETRNVEAVQRSKILPNCRFYSRILTDDRVQRQRYFDQFIGFARGVELVFFDPDKPAARSGECGLLVDLRRFTVQSAHARQTDIGVTFA